MWRSGSCFCGRALLTKASVQLSTDGWGCTPSLLVVWPEVTRPWGDWGLCGRVNDELPSGFMLRGRVLPCHSCCEPLPTHAFSGVFAALAGGFGSVSCGVTAPFLWVLLHSRFCILQDWSLWLPQSCGSLFFFFFYQIPLALKIRFPGNSQSFRQVPGWAAWCGVQNLHNSGRTFLVLLLSSLWVTHLVGWYLNSPFMCPSCCLTATSLSLDIGYLFLVGSSVLLSMLLNNSLWFCCSCRRKWVHLLLLHRLEP